MNQSPTQPNAARSETDQAVFVLFGGVPGAGKSTVLSAADSRMAGVTVLDSDVIRVWLATRFPRVAYAWLRPLVHLVHYGRILALLVAGPAHRRAVVVHDPGTRPLRLALLGWAVAARGWDPRLLYLDISRGAALRGQRRRRRQLGRIRFARHWRRWQRLRAALADPSRPGLWRAALAPWRHTRLADRDSAVDELLSTVARAAALVTGCRHDESRALADR